MNRGVTNLIDRMYAAATDEDEWQSVANLLAQEFSGAAALLIHHEDHKGAPGIDYCGGPAQATVARQSPRTARTIIDESLKADPQSSPAALIEFKDREALSWTACVKNDLSRGSLSGIAIAMTAKKTWHLDDARQLRLLVQAFHGAATLWSLSSLRRDQSLAAASLLECLSVAVIVLDGNGRVVGMNGRANSALHPNFLGVANTRSLRVNDALSRQQLRDAIDIGCNKPLPIILRRDDSASYLPSQRTPNRSVPAQDSAGQSSPARASRNRTSQAPDSATQVPAALVPLGEHHPVYEAATGKTRGYALIFKPQDGGSKHHSAGLFSAWNLSKAEARVALSLMTAASVGDISAKLHITSHTVKAHLKSIYRKTRARNLPEAACLFLTTAATFEAPEQRTEPAN
jgi:DNA-binding CsgD family transcriptional regulator